MAPEAIVEAAAGASVAGIEWGGDVHVPPGDLAIAETIGTLCRDAGVGTPSYGSYLRPGAPDEGDIEANLDSAAALGADHIRVWAGWLGSADATEADWQRTAERLRLIAGSAATRGLTVGLEYHRNTLTDTAEATLRLLQLAAHPGLFSYWQPVPGRGETAYLNELAMLRPFLSHLHVFHWLEGNIRRPLIEGEKSWQRLMTAFTPPPRWSKQSYAFLEFVSGDSIAQFRDDMNVLQQLCREAAP